MIRETEPKYPAILHFMQGDLEKEYIVVANEGPISSHKLRGYSYQGAVEIDSTRGLPVDETMHKQ